MKDLIKSPAKLVFVLVAIAACIGFFSGNLSEENFMILASGAFVFFYSYKGKADEPFAGK